MVQMGMSASCSLKERVEMNKTYVVEVDRGN